MAALLALAEEKIHAGQERLDLDLSPESKVRSSGDAVVRGHSSEVLWEALAGAYSDLVSRALSRLTFAGVKS